MFLDIVSHTVNRNGVIMQHNIVLIDLQACQAGVILITSILITDPGDLRKQGGVFIVCHASGCISC